MGSILSNKELLYTLHWFADDTSGCLCDHQSLKRLAVWLCYHPHGVFDLFRNCSSWLGFKLIAVVWRPNIVAALFCDLLSIHDDLLLLDSFAAICVWDAVLRVCNQMRFEQHMCHTQLHILRHRHLNNLLLRSRDRASAIGMSDISWVERLCQRG
jgi:hypothetical protein